MESNPVQSVRRRPSMSIATDLLHNKTVSGELSLVVMDRRRTYSTTEQFPSSHLPSPYTQHGRRRSGSMAALLDDSDSSPIPSPSSVMSSIGPHSAKPVSVPNSAAVDQLADHSKPLRNRSVFRRLVDSVNIGRLRRKRLVPSLEIFTDLPARAEDVLQRPDPNEKSVYSPRSTRKDCPTTSGTDTVPRPSPLSFWQTILRTESLPDMHYWRDYSNDLTTLESSLSVTHRPRTRLSDDDDQDMEYSDKCVTHIGFE